MLRRSISSPTDPGRMLTYCNVQVTHGNLLLLSSLSVFVRCSACGGRCSQASVLSVKSSRRVCYRCCYSITCSSCLPSNIRQNQFQDVQRSMSHSALWNSSQWIPSMPLCFGKTLKSSVMSSWCHFDIPTSERSLEVFWPGRKSGLWNDRYLVTCYSSCHCWFDLMHVRPKQVSSSGVLILRLLICVFNKTNFSFGFLSGWSWWSCAVVSPLYLCHHTKLCACVPACVYVTLMSALIHF